jgi:hypothetical protein
LFTDNDDLSGERWARIFVITQEARAEDIKLEWEKLDGMELLAWHCYVIDGG